MFGLLDLINVVGEVFFMSETLRYILILLFHIPYNKYIAIPMNNHTPKRIHAADFSPANM